VRLRKFNLLLILLIVGVMLAPNAVAGNIAEACCGVDVADLVVEDNPDPVCLGEAATINGTYNAYSQWSGQFPVAPYDSGVKIEIYDSAMVLLATYEQTLVTGGEDPGSYPGTQWSFSQDWTPPEAGTYPYIVYASSNTTWGRMEISVEGGSINAEDCNEPPDCSEAYPSMDIIWPPNHKLVDINILGVTDPDGDPVTITIDSIMQDEPVQTHGDGNFAPDGQGVGTDTASVRAERSGTKKVPGDGRVYIIGFTADDGQGGTCSGEVMVGVPHDVKDTPVDSGAYYDSTAGG
jgi:hypothetical protein